MITKNLQANLGGTEFLPLLLELTKISPKKNYPRQFSYSLTEMLLT